jgi:DNA-binding IclR family transcriptional regulator
MIEKGGAAMHEQHAPDTPSASAVQRTMSILECLDTSRRGLNISEVSRKLTIPKSSVHVLMVTLERLGYIQRATNGRDFCLSLKTYALGHRLAKMVSISEIALPHMQKLSSEVRLTCNLAVLDHDQGVFIQKVEPASSAHFDTYVGRRMDLHCTALGKVILAFSPPESTDHIFAKSVFRRYTPKTITTPQALRKEVCRVRKLGFAVDDEEEELGARCVAVPVMHQSVRFVAALSVSGTVVHVPPRAVEELLPRLRETAAAIAADNIPLPPLF